MHSNTCILVMLLSTIDFPMSTRIYFTAIDVVWLKDTEEASVQLNQAQVGLSSTDSHWQD